MSSNISRLTFAVACLMVVSLGLGARLGIDRVGNSYDPIERDLGRPSQVFVWIQAMKAKAEAATYARPALPVVPEQQVGQAPVSWNSNIMSPDASSTAH